MAALNSVCCPTRLAADSGWWNHGPLRLKPSVGPTNLLRLEQSVVLSVTADPESEHDVALKSTYCAMTAGDPRRVDRFPIMNLLELQTWVTGVVAEQAIRLARVVLHIGRKCVERRPEARRRPRGHSFSGSSGTVRPAA